MKKHTLLVGMVAAAVVFTGTWGSMQSVYADTTIQVIPASSAAAKKTTTSGVKSSTKNVASAVNSSTDIVIEVVKDSVASVKTGSIAGISYDKLVMADVEEAVNIRDSASEDGKLIGKFYKECAGTILEEKDGWTKVKTGNVTGWISNDYLLFGDEAIELAEKVVEKTATCTTDSLRVRKTADPNGTVLDLLANGDQIGVLSEQGEWVEVEYSDGDIGFVSSEYVTITDELGTGRSMEEISAMEEAERKVKEAAAAEAKKTESSSNGKSSTSATTENVAVTASVAEANDVTLLAALIQAEAGGQPYEGQVAVGNVVMNRLRSGRYGSSIYSVIYAKSQFGPAGSGKVAQIVAQGPKAACIQAAQAAINGTNYIGTATHFRNVNSGYTGIVIGSHVFW